VGCDGLWKRRKTARGKLYIDNGCTTREDTQKYVNVGDYCGLSGLTANFKTAEFAQKSLDDRAGCYNLSSKR
jgi:endoglucanase